MGQVLLANNAFTTLTAGCASIDTTITVASSASFPAVTTASTNWFYACLQDTFANMEIVKVTNISGLVWTITRAIGGTSARAFVAGSVVELRMTAETLSDVAAFTLTSSVQNSTPQFMTSVSGTNTITASLPAPFTAYAAGQKFHFLAAGTNTGAVTMNIGGVGAKAVTKQGATALVAGDLIINAVYEIIYDGTQFQVVGMVPTSAVVSQQPGEVCFFAVSSAPTGFLKANGALVSRTTYAALFAVIGTTFGLGDGSTTFGLPDLRGQFVRGFSDGGTVDSGRTFGTNQTDALQGHVHSFGVASIQSGGSVGGSNNLAQSGAGAWATGVPATDGTNGTPRTAAETRPVNVALLACIKT